MRRGKRDPPEIPRPFSLIAARPEPRVPRLYYLVFDSVRFLLIIACVIDMPP
jgi:hypothetical protein